MQIILQRLKEMPFESWCYNGGSVIDYCQQSAMDDDVIYNPILIHMCNLFIIYKN